MGNLSGREAQVLYLCAYYGYSYEEVARELGIKYHTVRTHVQNMLRATDHHSVLEASAWAWRTGWVQQYREFYDLSD